MRRTTLVLLTALAVCGLVPATASAQLGGPVILGGDDLTDHGFRSSTGTSEDGWLYIEKAIANIKPRVTRANDNSIAAFGSSDPGTDFPAGDAGAAIKNAAQKNGMTVRFFEGASAINTGFQQIANGTYRPAIVWISGDEAFNDLGSTGCEDSDPSTQLEGEAVAANAGRIDSFVNGGGGLMSHGTCYTWLSSLLPGLRTPETGGSDDLYLTAAGRSAFPGLSNTDVNAGPWHNHFEGNFGGLDFLVRSNSVNASNGRDAPVILGGARVSITADRTAPRVRVRGVPRRCVRSNFRAFFRITESNFRRVDILLDGRRIKRTVSKRFSVLIRARRLRSGRHRVTAVARDDSGNRRIVRRRFTRCARAARFTG